MGLAWVLVLVLTVFAIVVALQIFARTKLMTNNTLLFEKHSLKQK